MKNIANPLWKGDDAGYMAIHQWLRRNMGKASQCISCLSTKNIQWASKSHGCKRDLRDWIQLCVKCHTKYDNKKILTLAQNNKFFFNRWINEWVERKTYVRP